MSTLLSVNEVKLLLMETHYEFMDRLVVMDTSGRNTRGYSYAIVRASWHTEYNYGVRDKENLLVTSTTEHLRDARNKMGGGTERSEKPSTKKKWKQS